VEVFLENGFDGFVSKPIDVIQLNAVLMKFIRDKQTPEVIEEARKQQGKMPNIKHEEELPLLEVFSRDVKKALPFFETINKNISSFTDEDLELFTINAHSMKSALANIGETATSALASRLEIAGDARDMETIRSEIQNLIDALNSIIERIDAKTASSWALTDEDPVYLRDQLKKVSKACVEYDEMTAEATLADLRKMSWTKETKELLDKIAEHLLHSQFDEVVDVLGKLE
jgi:HPt (histidine-containing phosphotransfer) domain-containing protein